MVARKSKQVVRLPAHGVSRRVHSVLQTVVSWLGTIHHQVYLILAVTPTTFGKADVDCARRGCPEPIADWGRRQLAGVVEACPTSRMPERLCSIDIVVYSTVSVAYR
jgi:hypothetical protein